jgi:hypothetical protein
MKHLFAANYLRIIAGALLLISAAGCKKLNPEEEIPSYIHIDAIDLNVTNPNVQGTASHKITDAWVYVDNQILGAYELPCTLPVLAEGNHHILVRAGVKMNGSTVLRAIYPYYKGWEADVNLTRGVKSTLEPVVEYFSGINFGTTFMEDFDGNGNSFVRDANISAYVLDTSYGAFEGESGFIYLNSTDTIEFIGRSTTAFPMVANTEVWLEMNYRSNDVITVGVSTPDNSISWAAANIFPSSDWTKVYIRLNDAIGQGQLEGVTQFKIYIAFRHTTGSPDEPYLALDNLKLVK